MSARSEDVKRHSYLPRPTLPAHVSRFKCADRESFEPVMAVALCSLLLVQLRDAEVGLRGRGLKLANANVTKSVGVKREQPCLTDISRHLPGL